MIKLFSAVILLLLIFSTNNYSQDTEYGKRTGVDWNKFEQTDKISYMLGVFDVVSANDIKIIPTVSRTSAQQIVIALDSLYSDFRNINILIFDAIEIAHMQITGESDDNVNWWIRYYRSDTETRKSMWIRKNLPPPIFDDSIQK